jgi:hypothetical protein
MVAAYDGWPSEVVDYSRNTDLAAHVHEGAFE